MKARADWVVVHPHVSWIDGQTVVTTSATRQIEQRATCVVKAVRLRVRRPWLTVLDVMSACWVIARCRRGVYLSARSGRGWPLDMPLLAVARLCRRRPILIHLHSSAAAREPSRWRRLAARLVDVDRCAVIALCDAFAASVAQAYRLRRAEVVVVGNEAFVDDVPSDEYVAERRPQARGSGLALGFFSNLAVDKGVLDAVETFAALRRRGLAERFLVAGPLSRGSEGERIASVVGSTPGATLVGALTPDDRANFFNSIEWLLFPSVYVHEYSPMVLFEALAHGVPVIASRVGCVPSVLSAPSVSLETPFHAAPTIDEIGSIVRTVGPDERAEVRRAFRDQQDHHRQAFAALIDRLMSGPPRR